MGMIQKILKYFRNDSGATGAAESRSDAPNQQQRFPRVQVSAFHDLQMEITEPALGSPVSLINISTGGLGALIFPGQNWPQIGAQFRGRILLKDNFFSFSAKVIHRTETFLGAEFLLCSPELKTALNEYFVVELQSLELKAVNPKILRHDGEGEILWLRGKRGSRSYQVYVVYRQNAQSEEGSEILEFQLSFLGFFISWKKNEKIQFFEVTDINLVTDPSAENAGNIEGLMPLPRPTPEVCELCQRFLRALESMPEDLKWKLILILDSHSATLSVS